MVFGVNVLGLPTLSKLAEHKQIPLSPWERTAGELWQSDTGETQTIAAWESGYTLTKNNDGTITAEMKFSGGIPPLTLRRVPVMAAESSTPNEHDVNANWRRCYGVNPPCTDAERDLLNEKNQKMRDLKELMVEQGGYYGAFDEDGLATAWFANKDLKWCICDGSLHVSWINENQTQNPADDNLELRSVYINPMTKEEVRFALRADQDYGDHYATKWNYKAYETECAKVHSKFSNINCDGSGSSAGSSSSSNTGSGGSNSSGEDGESPALSMGILLGIPLIVGTSYFYGKQKGWL